MSAVQPDVVAGLTEALTSRLGDGLVSLILYGSAVRGGFERDVSDINVLVVLRDADPQLHAALREALAPYPRVQPLIVSAPDLPRTLRTFGLKFLSIQRSYRVLSGSDVLAAFTLDRSAHIAFTEEALRNLQLRLARNFVLLSAQPRRYTAYLLRTYPSVIVALSELLRLSGTELPQQFGARLPVLQQHFGADAAVLAELQALRHQPRPLSAAEELDWHGRVFALVTRGLRELEQL